MEHPATSLLAGLRRTGSVNLLPKSVRRKVLDVTPNLSSSFLYYKELYLPQQGILLGVSAKSVLNITFCPRINRIDRPIRSRLRLCFR